MVDAVGAEHEAREPVVANVPRNSSVTSRDIGWCDERLLRRDIDDMAALDTRDRPHDPARPRGLDRAGVQPACHDRHGHTRGGQLADRRDVTVVDLFVVAQEGPVEVDREQPVATDGIGIDSHFTTWPAGPADTTILGCFGMTS